MKISQVQKITLSALLLALTIILTRITPLQNFPLIPWVRISLGPALIIFTSLLCGPLYGAIVGAGSDILGIVLFPNSLGYGINPLFTVVYGLLGILPWLIYFLVKKVKNQQIPLICLISAMILIFAALVVLMFFSPIISANYSFELYHKIIIVSVAFVLMVGMLISLLLMNKHFTKKYGEILSLYKIAFVCLVSEFFLMLLLNSWVKSFYFEVDFLIVFFASAIVFFINVPLNTFVVEGLLILINKFKGQTL